MIKHFFTAALATVLAAVPAGAHPGLGLDAGHRAIVQAAYSAGVPTVVDPAMCEKVDADGFYNGHILGVCLRGRGWDANNLDTLRHEAQHLIQDCIVDGKANYDFDGATVFPNPVQAALDNGILTQDQIQKIWVTYAGMGLSEEDILMEVEAFAVAQGIPAHLIANQIELQCRA